MNTQRFGKLSDGNPDRQEYLTLNFAPSSAPERQQRWCNNGLSADFLGDYFAAFFPGEPMPESAIDLKKTVKATVSYIANELLENALKYSHESANLPISITLHLYERQILFQVVNYASEDRAQQYVDFVRQIDAGNLEELYIAQLEATSLGDGGSCMGILTILHDYGAEGGWKFEPASEDPKAIRVSTAIRLVV